MLFCMCDYGLKRPKISNVISLQKKLFRQLVAVVNVVKTLGTIHHADVIDSA